MVFKFNFMQKKRNSKQLFSKPRTPPFSRFTWARRASGQQISKNFKKWKVLLVSFFEKYPNSDNVFRIRVYFMQYLENPKLWLPPNLQLPTFFALASCFRKDVTRPRTLEKDKLGRQTFWIRLKIFLKKFARGGG